MPQWGLRMLGSEELRWRGGLPIVMPDIFWPIAGLLLTAPRHRLCRGRLAALLWADADEAAARHCLASALWRIRARVPEPDRLVMVQGQDVVLSAAHGWIDVLSFARRAARVISGTGPLDQESERNKLALALAAYGGDLLIDRSLEPIALERERLRTLFLEALTALATAEARAGRWSHVRRAAQRLCDSEPFSEDAQRLLMTAHVECGSPARALRQFRQFEQFLHDELGIAPTAETRQLAERLGATPPARQAPRLPPPQRELLVRAREQLARSLALLDETLGA